MACSASHASSLFRDMTKNTKIDARATTKTKHSERSLASTTLPTALNRSLYMYHRHVSINDRIADDDLAAFSELLKVARQKCRKKPPVNECGNEKSDAKQHPPTTLHANFHRKTTVQQ
jgi:hypothetical protein